MAPGMRPYKALTCVSIAANAISAGGIFTFPLLAPALAAHLKLTPVQLTSIVLAGMAGQYPFSSLVGKITDRYGPRFCSLAAAICFSVAFSMFSLEISKTPDDITQPSESSFHLLTIYFALAGLGTVFSYFSFLFAATKTFPEYLGLASGCTTALFGLSPLVLSFIASSYFTDSEGELNVSGFLNHLAVISGCIHLIGTINLGFVPQAHSTQSTPSPPPNETTALLPQPSIRPPSRDSALDLIKDPYFWLLGVFVLISLGTCEMVISNIGTIVLSLPGISVTANSTPTQVRILSLSNTFSRLISGLSADLVSPIGGPPVDGASIRKHLISRISFLCGASILIASASLWMLTGVYSQSDLWPLSVGMGTAYGTIFTILPSIMSAIWGVKNIARNYGIITYAPFIGTPIFSYLYAFISSYNSGDRDICEGRICWITTFRITFSTAIIGLISSAILWRRWKGKL